MIIDLPNTTVADVNKRLVSAREEGGAVALGRVLTFLIYTPHDGEEQAIAAANEASSEHPMRIVVVTEPEAHSVAPGLSAQLRLGGDAGASEVVVLRPEGPSANSLPGLVNGLLLPDTPVVTWWPSHCPDCMAETSLGQISQRRILDSQSLGQGIVGLGRIASGYRPGDTDLAWGRITGWRTQLAATLDYLEIDTIHAATVAGVADNPSVALLAGWLAVSLGQPVTLDPSAPEGIGGVYSVQLDTSEGDISLVRTDDQTVLLRVPGQPDFPLLLPRRGLSTLVAEELRRLAPDTIYGRVLAEGIPMLKVIGQ
ncbi:glucose-6-phosphate dehydrogenase assembly protein OpcA [Pontimonas salivibrio]|uniref:Glucose-6-phosphate dehydrogenase assembly protein OpcA n=1 Tax=Pontimonas salivibrio TaxID=1159327 RepID=A0A2L2BQT1_9MICO|nr:glucose-6-phosphate dehydrogenase assembly protein OpcA [Pontimonas salivibrio]AVG24020.1 glucose-6-phosphate dehydrogenase assembly protein OpcA [Pontimonas salivibrio]